jgi:7-keto-8-aminopelargonate synthetase-like enzyme
MFITRMPAARVARPSTTIESMSDHTERLRKLRDRILAAKEFL